VCVRFCTRRHGCGGGAPRKKLEALQADISHTHALVLTVVCVRVCACRHACGGRRTKEGEIRGPPSADARPSYPPLTLSACRV